MRGLRRARRGAPAGPIHAPLAPAARQLVSNLLVTDSGAVLAGYRLGPARWDFTGLDAKAQALDAVQDGWASLVEPSRHVMERVTTRPHPVAEWAGRLDARTPHPLPDVHSCSGPAECQCETWNRHLLRMQSVIARSGMDDKITARYFHVGQVEPGLDVRAQVAAWSRRGVRPQAEVREVLAAEKRTHDVVSTQPGWLGRRLTEPEQVWVRQRSMAVGIPARPLPRGDLDGWASGELCALDMDVRWVEDPWDRSVQVVAWRDGQRVERRVQVLTVARLSDQHYPANAMEPWQVFAERATDSEGRSFPVEWCITGELKTGEELARQAELDLNLALNIERDYRAFQEPPPDYTRRGIARAKRIRDEVTTGDTRTAARFVGTINVAIYGEDITDAEGRVIRTAEEVVEERSEALRRLYSGNRMRMELVVPPAQSAKLAEFIAGEPYDTTGFQRQVPLDYLAAGFPNVTASVGDGHGPYLGFTRGAARRPVFHDPHYATEGQGDKGRQQNVWVVGGTLGSGKSVMLGSIAYNAARRSIKTIVRDPSGPLGRLCSMPELAQWAREINLLDAPNGVLSPPALIREPRSEEYEEPDAHARASRLARGERSALVQDIARRCLGVDLYRHKATQGELRRAARMVEWTTAATMWDLVDVLAAGDEHARELAEALRDASETPKLSLLFAPRGEGGDFAGSQHRDAVLTVISTPGIKRAPDEVKREDWNPEELAANPVTHLASLYTTRELYGKAMSTRALAIFDEAEDMTDGGTGRAALARLGRDHSKWNVAVYLGLKNVDDGILGGGLRNFLAGAFVGRMATMEPALEMLSVLNVEDKAYARTLMRLSSVVPGEFVHLDADGDVGGIRVDVDYFPRLRDTLLTNPDQEGSTADAWARAEVMG